ncbi:uncharacterized protein LOC113282710 isoform X1 [Papaver somniferum]|uniref:uncharacterized protein LOC113282710 isoform X1 n=1 Tax=Papaver somniferum TaxID=3469 RepID=UPI000E6FF667|nr:uncharacterized protein LOC113282710 isoform X1 [Papaver somniferum]
MKPTLDKQDILHWLILDFPYQRWNIFGISRRQCRSLAESIIEDEKDASASLTDSASAVHFRSNCRRLSKLLSPLKETNILISGIQLRGQTAALESLCESFDSSGK